MTTLRKLSLSRLSFRLINTWAQTANHKYIFGFPFGSVDRYVTVSPD